MGVFFRGYIFCPFCDTQTMDGLDACDVCNTPFVRTKDGYIVDNFIVEDEECTEEDYTDIKDADEKEKMVEEKEWTYRVSNEIARDKTDRKIRNAVEKQINKRKYRVSDVNIPPRYNLRKRTKCNYSERTSQRYNHRNKK